MQLFDDINMISLGLTGWLNDPDRPHVVPERWFAQVHARNYIKMPWALQIGNNQVFINCFVHLSFDGNFLSNSLLYWLNVQNDKKQKTFLVTCKSATSVYIRLVQSQHCH